MSNTQNTNAVEADFKAFAVLGGLPKVLVFVGGYIVATETDFRSMNEAIEWGSKCADSLNNGNGRFPARTF